MFHITIGCLFAIFCYLAGGALLRGAGLLGKADAQVGTRLTYIIVLR